MEKQRIDLCEAQIFITDRKKLKQAHKDILEKAKEKQNESSGNRAVQTSDIEAGNLVEAIKLRD